MTGMTAENRKKLDGLIVEYGVCLDQLDGIKDKKKAMEEMAKSALQIESKHFVKLATAIWKNNREAEQKDLEAQLDLFELYRPADFNGQAATASPAASQETAASRDLVVTGQGLEVRRKPSMAVVQ